MTYKSGDKTLKNIGKTLGNITPTMVNRLCYTAIEKTKILTLQKPIEFLTIEEDRFFLNFIDDIRKNAVIEFINLFKQADYDIYDFLNLLNKKQYLCAGDYNLINEKEIEELVYIKLLLLENNKEEVKNILLKDISKDINVFSTFQCIISHLAFPNKKRGRPRKE